jgi:ABC-type glycerol-3-phosphate transport system substrate-binding protein
MKLSQRQIIILVAVIVVVAGVGYFITANLRSKTAPPIVELTVWGSGDASPLFQNIVSEYKAFRPNVTVEYVNMEAEGYESKVTDALASGDGPDVFMIGNRSLPKAIAKLAPAPAKQISIRDVQDIFPRVVEQDFVASSSVYALPLSIDTLALLYNKDIFDAAGIVSPPRTWSEFQALIPTLRVINESRQLTRAGAAIGGSEATVPGAVDILHLLMLQSGTEMVDVGHTRVGFDSDEGVAAMNYYLQFSDAASSVYTWNETQQNAFDSFLAGKTAMVFGYLKDLQALKQKSPFLPAGVAVVPQTNMNSPVSYAEYDGFAVSKQSKATEWAWDFVVFATTNKDVASVYATNLGRAPALRELLDDAKNSVELGVFARQALTARSWYEPDARRITSLFNSAIARVIRGEIDTRQALGQVRDQVDQMLRVGRR